MSTHSYIDILKYWVAAIRHEESLSARPKAIRQRGPASFNWQSPIGGHTYFKAARNERLSELILGDATEASFEVNDEQRSFLGRQVRQIYYRQDHAWQVDEKAGSSVVFGFPALYLPRTDELASLIRFRASLDWLDKDGSVVDVPSKRARQNQKFPSEPHSYRLKRTEDEDEELLPLSLDAKVMSQGLGFSDETVLDFTNALRSCADVTSAQMIEALIKLLETGEWTETTIISDEKGSSDLLLRLIKAVQTRLKAEGSSLIAYDIALIHDGAQLFTTHHLRRDLSMMISGRLRQALVQDSPLRAYLSGSAPLPAYGLLIGQSASEAASVSQRDVAERFLGSVFTAAQGPPGTGKTRLILDVAAHMLIARMRTLATKDVLDGPSLLVTSTNNRAVDQVLVMLQQDLPWGLRAGSQQVTETATVTVIDRALGWLDEHADLEIDLDAEKKRFLEIYDAAVSETTSHEKQRNVETQRLALRHELDALSALTLPSLFGNEARLLEVGLHLIDDLLDRITLLKRRLSALDRLLKDANQRAFEAAAAAWQKLKRGPWADSKEVFDKCGLTRGEDPISTPSKDASIEEICGTWRMALSAFVDDLDDIYSVVNRVRNFRESENRIERVREQLAVLPKKQLATLDHDAMNGAQFVLLKSANRLRKAWICHHEPQVRQALQRLKDHAIEFRSLRRFFQEKDRDVKLIRTIFPVIGSTLLSVANVLGQEPDSVSHVVIDEGGQCHPAYAVSALMRAKQALVIGDVFQLEPVFSLSLDDELRVQEATRISLAEEKFGDFRVFESCGNSAQRLADSAVGTPPRLVDHFRSDERLIGLCNEMCEYGLNVHTKPSSLPVRPRTLSSPFVGTTVAGIQHRTRGSWSNQKEAATVLEWLVHLLSKGLSPNHLAVLTPYVGQLDVIRTLMQNHGLPVFDQTSNYTASSSHIPIGTVHRFQGGERDIILYSSVVTQPRSLHFQNQRVNLLNVAVSRARQHFVTVGDFDILAQGRYTGHLIQRTEKVERGRLIVG